MTSDEKFAALLRRVAELEKQVQRQNDIQAVRTLQFKYGYYMDKCLFAEIVDLFSEEAELRFMGGIFRGKAGARRLYGGSSGLNGPAYGMLFEHLIVQDIVDISEDGRTAQGRFRTFMQGGVHETKKDAPAQIPKQFWEGGVYENEYIKEDGVWKFKLFNYRVVYQANYESGWAHSPVTPLMVSNFNTPYPENPRGPDEVGPPPPRWPEPVVMPFHYPHPVTGKFRS
jgi:hypothetical protein